MSSNDRQQFTAFNKLSSVESLVLGNYEKVFNFIFICCHFISFSTVAILSSRKIASLVTRRTTIGDKTTIFLPLIRCCCSSLNGRMTMTRFKVDVRCREKDFFLSFKWKRNESIKANNNRWKVKVCLSEKKETSARCNLCTSMKIRSSNFHFHYRSSASSQMRRVNAACTMQGHNFHLTFHTLRFTTFHAIEEVWNISPISQSSSPRHTCENEMWLKWIFCIPSIDCQVNEFVLGSKQRSEEKISLFRQSSSTHFQRWHKFHVSYSDYTYMGCDE